MTQHSTFRTTVFAVFMFFVAAFGLLALIAILDLMSTGHLPPLWT